jgi:hypothetical protein
MSSGSSFHGLFSRQTSSRVNGFSVPTKNPSGVDSRVRMPWLSGLPRPSSLRGPLSRRCRGFCPFRRTSCARCLLCFLQAPGLTPPSPEDEQAGASHQRLADEHVDPR